MVAGEEQPGSDSTPVPSAHETTSDVVTRHVFRSTPTVVINDPVGVLKEKLLATSDPATKRNIQAAIDTLNRGEAIRPNQIFADGRLIEFQEWKPEMGPPFTTHTVINILLPLVKQHTQTDL
jgi:hypothetical protein